MIESYLAELSRLLRVSSWRKRRILAEVEAHLRDAGADEDAIERFGTAHEVARRFNELAPKPRPRLAAACAALTITVGLLALHAFRRAELVAGSPPWWQLAIVTLAALAPPATGGLLVLRRR